MTITTPDQGTSDYFVLSEEGHGRWSVRHQVTGIFAGTILKTAQGYRLKNENHRTIGNFSTIGDALEQLYETA